MRTLPFIFTIFLLIGCGSKKKVGSTANRTISVAAAHKERTGEDPLREMDTNEENKIVPREPSTKADAVINTALTFSGVRYKYGGTTKRGMDCSGLLYVSFAEHNIQLPRTSIHMAEEGKKIRVRDVAKGDLLFFRTNKRAKRINHVGMVVEVKGDDVKFIHASTTRGVIVSSLRDGFWNNAFVKATRVL